MLSVYNIKKLSDMREELREIGNKEAVRVWRLARRARNHGCSLELFEDIRSEGWELYGSAYPERLLDPDTQWKYAFRC